MNYHCDTAENCGVPQCAVKTPHVYDPRPSGCNRRFSCGHAGHPVRCHPIEEPRETHTCYFCDHTGQDVNRIAKPISRFKERQTVYCCDNAILCDERWRADDEGGLAVNVADIILEEALREWGLGALASAQLDIFQKRTTARIMKLIELRFRGAQ